MAALDVVGFLVVLGLLVILGFLVLLGVSNLAVLNLLTKSKHAA